ncbi:MAG: hypothetical protein EBU90_20395, partial [Proteobacteria bacterium]|nr:hypothetical protein [Pseudomonadota bacterium]
LVLVHLDAEPLELARPEGEEHRRGKAAVLVLQGRLRANQYSLTTPWSWRLLHFREQEAIPVSHEKSCISVKDAEEL